MRKPMHCCSLMDDHLKDYRVQIFYSPQMREYYIPLKDNPAVQGIFIVLGVEKNYLKA